MSPPLAAQRGRWPDAPRVVPAGLLDGWAWGYTSGAFHALGHRFGVRTTDAEIGAYLGWAFAPLSRPGPASAWYSLLDCGPDVEPYLLYWRDRLVMRHESPAVVLGHLLWHVNRQAITGRPDLVLLHAAAAERDGVGVVLPGAMEAGKTTLVAGLVQTGFRYLSDEAAVVEPQTMLLRAYPKPLSIDPGSWRLFGDLRPQVSDATRPYLRRQWQVPATAIRPDAVTATAVPRLVILPRYVPGAATELEPSTRAGLLGELARLTFAFHDAAERNLTVLAALLRRCRCFRLTVGDLAEACTLVQRAVEDMSPVEPGGLARSTGGRQ